MAVKGSRILNAQGRRSKAFIPSGDHTGRKPRTFAKSTLIHPTGVRRFTAPPHQVIAGNSSCFRSGHVALSEISVADVP